MKTTRILLIDDHPVVRKGVASILRIRPEWEICGEASDGRAAVEAALRLRPDVIVMDISMPEMNGLEAARRILKEHPAARILVLSMHESEELAREVFASGVRGYLLKSDIDMELISAIDALQQGRLFSSPRITDSLIRGYAGKAPLQMRPAAQLTSREREIVQLVAEGKSNKEVASSLSISVKTVETHRAHIMEKLDLNNIPELVRYAIRNHIIEP